MLTYKCDIEISVVTLAVKIQSLPVLDLGKLHIALIYKIISKLDIPLLEVAIKFYTPD